MKKALFKSILGFFSITLILFALYFPSDQLGLDKNFWEILSLASLVIGTLFCFLNYRINKHLFSIWFGTILVALSVRDWHGVEFNWDPFSSVPYYTLILIAIFWAYPKRSLIIAALKQQPTLLLLWSTTFFLWVLGYSLDHGALHSSVSIDRSIIDPIEDYLEEATEAIGSVLLMISAFVSINELKDTLH